MSANNHLIIVGFQQYFLSGKKYISVGHRTAAVIRNNRRTDGRACEADLLFD